MSRIGKLPINIPAGVEISVNGNVVTVKGKEGVLTQEVNPSIKVNFDKEKAEVTFDIDEAYDPEKTKAVMIAHTLGNPFVLAAVKSFE